VEILTNDIARLFDTAFGPNLFYFQLAGSSVGGTVMK
jgi:hypothetical protein